MERDTAARSTPKPGTKLGRYAIIEPLGSGGMGVVYRARDEKLERDVAIKILAPGVLSDEDARTRFRKEALALAKLSHAHIAAVYDVGEDNGVDYIVMECVPGQSLAEKLKSGQLSLRDATSIMLQVAEALEEAHDHGVVHRDLKPANVMITPKGQAKVLDFGLAKLLAPSGSDATVSMSETHGLLGTPLYMSPEQAQGKSVDFRTDLWSLGVVYYESLAGRAPFQADSSLAVLRAIVEQPLQPIRQLRPDIPSLAERIITHSLEKEAANRYGSAAEVVRDASELLTRLSADSLALEKTARPISRGTALIAAVVLLAIAAAAGWLFYRSSRRHWARQEAIPQSIHLRESNKSLEAYLLLEQARKYLPADPQLKQITDESTTLVSINSTPAGATVAIQDYLSPNQPWHALGSTPLKDVRIPKGYFRWKVSGAGSEMVIAPETEDRMMFSLDAARNAPSGMVYSGGGTWTKYIGFIGWVGPYNLPPYYLDQYEVTNRDFQKFVDSGGYENRRYWPEQFTKDSRNISWQEALTLLRDTTGRPGPATWIGGHYPEGKADFPVTGVSWFEASAYAAFAGKQLPVFSQWYQSAPPDVAAYTVQASNISGSALAPAGAYKGLGPYGTYDIVGNAREWVANPVEGDLRFILGGSWRSPSYLSTDPEALSPFDRSDANGFRCVRNISPLPEAAAQTVKPLERDFSRFKPVSDDVFHAYELLYAYPKIPLNAKVEGVMEESDDWREEKVTFDAAYNGERMAAYLFLPKKVRPPYQTVLFFPSARVMFLPPDSHNGRGLGDIRFFDYIVQSGRAVMYPIYEDTYERRNKFSLPGGSSGMEIRTDWYKDAARSLDYLATRPDIDSSKLGYVGVSMGSANGVIFATLLQDRLKTAILLDGGYFLGPPPPGGDQADFAPRMKIPVLMVNGRYDFTFSVDKAQNPLFAMLGTPEADKRHVILDTPHDVTEQRPQLVKAVLDWLDHYLGRVGG
jgi:eukaryotic-like serine/threonine-protein kinase